MEQDKDRKKILKLEIWHRFTGFAGWDFREELPENSIYYSGARRQESAWERIIFTGNRCSFLLLNTEFCILTPDIASLHRMKGIEDGKY